MTEDLELEKLPVHELKRICKEKHPNIKLKPVYKKEMIVNIILTGKDPAENAREPKLAPKLEPKKVTPLAVLPEEIKDKLEHLKTQGLQWTIDEESCCVNFELPTGQFDVVIDPRTNKPEIDSLTQTPKRKPLVYAACANLDQPANNILNAALSCFPKARPIEQGRV